MNLNAVSLEDFEQLARRRLPRFVFDLIQGGVEAETGLTRNRKAFEALELHPRFLSSTGQRSQEANLWGQTFASGFGIPPMGAGDLFRRGLDAMLAQSAEAERIPFVMSSVSMAMPEEVRPLAPRSFRMQLYLSKDRAISADMVRRIEDLGVQHLVLTVDTPVMPKRERGLRNRVSLPIQANAVPRLALQCITRPAWLYEYFVHGGMPLMKNWAPYAPEGASAAQVAAFYRSQSPCLQEWKDVEWLRERWPGKLVLKGIVHPAEAQRAQRIGVDGVILSNHGGKVLDAMPSPISVLPDVRRAVGPDFVVMVDSGIRRGSDVVVARALGADFVFVGRPALYAAVAGGASGARRMISILKQEIDITLALLGCSSLEDVTQDVLLPQSAKTPGRAAA